MDDTQDKIRRNLVIFSAAIVIGWYLDMKLTDISKLILSTDISNVNAFRFWMVILVILVYLSIRYRFSDAIISQISFLQSELKTQRESYLLEYLQVKINQINRTGQFLPIFDASLEKSVNRKNNSDSKPCSTPQRHTRTE